MREFITCCCLGLVIILGVAVFGEEPPTELQVKCLVPYIRRNIVADPTTKVCYSVQQGTKTVLDCKTLVTIEPFKQVKNCFQQ